MIVKNETLCSCKCDIILLMRRIILYEDLCLLKCNYHVCENMILHSSELMLVIIRIILYEELCLLKKIHVCENEKLHICENVTLRSCKCNIIRRLFFVKMKTSCL